MLPCVATCAKTFHSVVAWSIPECTELGNGPGQVYMRTWTMKMMWINFMREAEVADTGMNENIRIWSVMCGERDRSFAFPAEFVYSVDVDAKETAKSQERSALEAATHLFRLRQGFSYPGK